MASLCYIFFDVDDTLVEWTVSWRHAFVQAAAEAGLEVSPDQAWQAIDRAFAEHYDDCLGQHAATGDEHAFWLAYDALILARLGVTQNLREAAERVVALLTRPEAIRLYEEVPQVLGALSQAGARMGIVTGRPRAGPDLEALGIRGYFHPVIDAFAAGASKSNGRMFHLAAAAAADAGLPAWHVGDIYDEDVLGARSAGIRPVLLDRKDEHSGADCARISNLRQLPDVILGNHAESGS